MDERRLSVNELARLTQLSKPTVRNLKNGKTTAVSLVTVAKLCSALYVPIGALFTYKSNEYLRSEMDVRGALMGADKP